MEIVAYPNVSKIFFSCCYRYPSLFWFQIETGISLKFAKWLIDGKGEEGGGEVDSKAKLLNHLRPDYVI